MKTFICYDSRGHEVWWTPTQQYLKAGNHNSAQKKVQKKFGPQASAVYTEI